MRIPIRTRLGKPAAQGADGWPPAHGRRFREQPPNESSTDRRLPLSILHSIGTWGFGVEGLDQLLTISEFALGLAGFGAIALMLGQRDAKLEPGVSYVVRFMIVNALAPGLLALFPVVLDLLGVRPPALWRWASGLYIVGAPLFVWLSLRQERALSRTGRLVVPRVPSNVMWAVATSVHLIQLLNLIGWPLPPSAGLFLLGLWVLLCLAGAQFLTLIFLYLR